MVRFLLWAGLFTWLLYLYLRGMKAQSGVDIARLELEIVAGQARVLQDQRSLEIMERHWALALDSFSAVDIETTGLVSVRSQLLQVAIVHFTGGKVADVWSTYFDPGRPLPISPAKVNRITDATLIGAPRFTELAHEVRQRLGARPLVGHNLQYDTAFLRQELQREGYSWIPAYGYCTMRKAFGEPVPDPPRTSRTFTHWRTGEVITHKVPVKYPWKTLADAMNQWDVPESGPLHEAVADAVGSGMVFVAQAASAVSKRREAVFESETHLAECGVLLDRSKVRQQRIMAWNPF